jgi:signal transduction histidine kinase/CheY-like chemotaxis protein
MELAAARSPASERRWSSSQIFFAIVALGWIPFVLSAMSYRSEWWFPWLISGRVLFLLAAVCLAVLTYAAPRLRTHSELVYSIACLALQASFGALEEPSKVEFYNFTSVFLLMMAVFTRQSFRAWLKFSYVPALVIVALPLLSKDPALLNSVGKFVDTLSPVVASAFVSLLIGHTTCRKNELLRLNEELQHELTQERDHQKEIIEKQAKELSESRIFTEIAQATQMLAHDVRKPFSMLRMTIDHLLMARTSEDVKAVAQESLPEVREALIQADAFVQDVLDVRSNLHTEKQSVDPAQILETCLGSLLRGMSEIVLERDYHHSANMLASTNHLKRIVTNIVTNALEATQTQGTIRVSTHDVFRNGENIVRVSIWNSGPALSEAEMNDIFELYHTSGKSGGHGIGLAIVKKFVTEHQGRVWCESGENGNGVTFSFEIPACPKAEAKENTTEDDEAELIERLNSALGQRESKIKILVVDDERLYRDTAAHIMEHDFFSPWLDVRTAATPAETRTQVAETQPDLIFLDVDLGRDQIFGLDLLKELRQSGCTSTICLHSNRVFDARKGELRKFGADAVLPKPISRVELMRVLGEIGV